MKKERKKIHTFIVSLLILMIINYVNVLCIDAIIYIITYSIHVVVAGHGQSNFNTFVNLIVICMVA